MSPRTLSFCLVVFPLSILVYIITYCFNIHQSQAVIRRSYRHYTTPYFNESLMASSSSYSSSSANYQSGGLHVAMILFMFLLISLIPFKTFGLGFPIYKEDHGSNSVQLKEKEKAVGSRPPGCINKCLNCRPCMATLVIQPHQWRWNNKFKRFFKTTSHHDEEGGSSYYLLSWKCKCNNKLFKP